MDVSNMHENIVVSFYNVSQMSKNVIWYDQTGKWFCFADMYFPQYISAGKWKCTRNSGDVECVCYRITLGKQTWNLKWILVEMDFFYRKNAFLKLLKYGCLYVYKISHNIRLQLFLWRSQMTLIVNKSPNINGTYCTVVWDGFWSMVAFQKTDFHGFVLWCSTSLINVTLS